MAVLEGVLDFTSKKPEGFFSTSRSDNLSDVGECPIRGISGVYFSIPVNNKTLNETLNGGYSQMR